MYFTCVRLHVSERQNTPPPPLTLALPDIPPPVQVIFPATLKVLRDAAPHPPHPPTASPSDRHGFSCSSPTVFVESKEASTVGGGKVMSPSP